MRLDRNAKGRGKYALLKIRRLAEIEAWDGGDGEALDRQAVLDAVALLERAGVIDYGLPGTQSEFFVIRLKDRYATPAFVAYAAAAQTDGEGDYGDDVFGLALRSGPYNQWCQKPD